MTVPACLKCNRGFSGDEMRVAAVVGTCSSKDEDQAAVRESGWIWRAMARDAALREFVDSRLGQDGMFRVDSETSAVFSRVMRKTATGLLFFEFGRAVLPDALSFIGIEHTRNVEPSAFVELHRRNDNMWAEVTPSVRALERQVIAANGLTPPNMPPWRSYIPGWFEYMFLRRSNDRLLTAMILHSTLVVLLECPWPYAAGPLRKGRPPRTGTV